MPAGTFVLGWSSCSCALTFAGRTNWRSAPLRYALSASPHTRIRALAQQHRRQLWSIVNRVSQPGVCFLRPRRCDGVLVRRVCAPPSSAATTRPPAKMSTWATIEFEAMDTWLLPASCASPPTSLPIFALSGKDMSCVPPGWSHDMPFSCRSTPAPGAGTGSVAGVSKSSMRW